MGNLNITVARHRHQAIVCTPGWHRMGVLTLGPDPDGSISEYSPMSAFAVHQLSQLML